MPELDDALITLTSWLNRQRIPYMVIGGQAVLLYGEPRLTKDIDVPIGAHLDRLPDVLALVQSIDL